MNFLTSEQLRINKEYENEIRIIKEINYRLQGNINEIEMSEKDYNFFNVSIKPKIKNFEGNIMESRLEPSSLKERLEDAGWNIEVKKLEDFYKLIFKQKIDYENKIIDDTQNMELNTLIQATTEQEQQNNFHLSFEDEPVKQYIVKNENGFWFVENKTTNQRKTLMLGDAIEFYNPTEAHDSNGKWVNSTFGNVIGFSQKYMSIKYRSHTYLMGNNAEIYNFYPIKQSIEKATLSVGWIALGLFLLFVIIITLTFTL